MYRTAIAAAHAENARERHEWKWAYARPLSDLRGELHGRAVLTARPQVVPQHGRASTTRLLRQHHLPPSDQRLHGAGGRPHGDRARGGVQLRREVRGRNSAGPQAHGSGHRFHGQLWAEHKRLSVLCDPGTNAVARRKAHHSRPNLVGHEGGAADGNGGRELGRQAPAGHADSPRETPGACTGGGRARGAMKPRLHNYVFVQDGCILQ